MKNKLQEKLQKLAGVENASDFLIGSVTEVAELANIKAKDGALIIERTNNTLYIFDEVSGWVAVSGAGGGSGLADVVDDTTPQLGGDLDVNGNDIISSTGVIELKLNDAAGASGVLITDNGGSTVFGVASDGTIQASGTIDGRDLSVDGTKLDGIEALADVTDEANVVSSLDGATLTAVTVAGTDKVIVQDASDSDNIKTVTAQSIADLGASGSGITDIVDDTTPQLGGNLDLNGNTVGDASAADLTKLSELIATSTELNYIDGVTSNIQTQLDTKTTVSSGSGAPASTPSNVGDIYVDTTDDIIYIASGTASSADWEEQVVVDGTSLADGEILVWDATNSKFVRDPRVTGTGAVTAVDMNSIMGNFYSTTTASTTGTLTLNNAIAGGRTTIRIQNATAGGPTISGTGITVSKKGDWTTNYDTTDVNTIYIEMVTATLAWAWITAVD